MKKDLSYLIVVPIILLSTLLLAELIFNALDHELKIQEQQAIEFYNNCPQCGLTLNGETAK